MTEKDLKHNEMALYKPDLVINQAKNIFEKDIFSLGYCDHNNFPFFFQLRVLMVTSHFVPIKCWPSARVVTSLNQTMTCHKMKCILYFWWEHVPRVHTIDWLHIFNAIVTFYGLLCQCLHPLLSYNTSKPPLCLGFKSPKPNSNVGNTIRKSTRNEGTLWF